MKPPVVIHLKPKSAYHIRAVLKQSKTDSPKPLYAHPYEESRRKLSALAFAQFILQAESRIIKHAGADFIDGKYATPLIKLREANTILKRLGLAQIAGDPSWRV